MSSEDFDLQSQLDDSGFNQDQSFGNYGQQGSDYLQNQQDWSFGNYGDQWSNLQNQVFNDNISNTPAAGWSQSGTDWGSVDQTQGTQFNSLPQQMYDAGQGALGSTQSFLAQLFNGQQGGSGGGSGLKLLAALAEGSQNKRRASNIQNIVNQQQARTDPFGSQRQFYQQQLQNTVQDPYSQPIVKSQVDQIAQAQAIKDAAAGRRSNSATSSPAMLAAQAQIAQKYMDSLYTPSGANISPNASGLDQLISGSNSNVNGYLSPIMSALGYGSQNNSTQAQLAAIQQLLANAKGA